MPLSHRELRKRFHTFWQQRGHKEVPAIPLIPQNDPTTLFTGSGMQQLVPYLLGEVHSLGTKLYNIQHCIRAQDIEEVGDNRHDTFFEMMGNWSLGEYFKEKQLEYLFDFLTHKEYGLGMNPQKLYVTVFAGHKELPADEESIAIWQGTFAKVGIDAKVGERIFAYGPEKNWWSRAGVPESMPAGEPGGPDSEVFYQFDIPHNPAFGKECHPNCDCGRFMEIGNSVFMQYKKQTDGTFAELPKKNVDFGGGLERLLTATHDNPDMFVTDVFSDSIQSIVKSTNTPYEKENKAPIRILADHVKTAAFLIKEGVRPANKEQGYILRRLLRRAMVKARKLNQNKLDEAIFAPLVQSVLKTYDGIYFEADRDQKDIQPVIEEEVARFSKALEKGIHELQKLKIVDGKAAFDLYQNYGFPLELTEELIKESGQHVDRKQFYAEFQKHKDLSRTASAGKFKGGLADHSEQTLKYHTATHLLHQALFDVIGTVRQEGSNITAERLRFDFYSNRKPTDEEVKKVESIVNEKISQSMPMRFKILPKGEAEKIGARSFFKEKYPDMVKIYYIGGEDEKPETAYSKEFCGGPHVTNTKEIGLFQIIKFEKIGSNLYRVYAK